jgi:hypothetical protein
MTLVVKLSYSAAALGLRKPKCSYQYPEVSSMQNQSTGGVRRGGDVRLDHSM